MLYKLSYVSRQANLKRLSVSTKKSFNFYSYLPAKVI